MTEGVTRFTVRRAHVLVDALRATSKVLLLYALQTIIPVHNPTSISIDEMHQGWPDVEVLEELLMNTPPNNMVSHIAVAFAAHLERSAESDYQTPLCTWHHTTATQTKVWTCCTTLASHHVDMIQPEIANFRGLFLKV